MAGIGAVTVPGGGAALTDQGVKARHAEDLLRHGGWVPAGAIDQSIPDRLGATGVFVLTSGTLYLVGGIVIPGGRAVSSISFMSGSTAAVTPTNQWCCLVDKSLNVLATTVDDTVNAWAANTTKTFTLATTLGGATPGGTYTPAATMEIYAGLMVAAATPPNVKAVGGNANLNAIGPVNSGTSSIGLTTPASLGATAGAITAVASQVFAWVS